MKVLVLLISLMTARAAYAEGGTCPPGYYEAQKNHSVGLRVNHYRLPGERAGYSRHRFFAGKG